MRAKFIAPLALLVALIAGHAPQAQAAGTVAWVSSAGSDVQGASSTPNTCTNPSQPCLSLAAAIAVAGAGGQVQCLSGTPLQQASSSEFGATFTLGTINVPIVINCPGGFIQEGITLGSGANPVVIRGLTINGLGASGTGITSQSTGTVILDGITVINFAVDGLAITAGSSVTVNNSFFGGNGGAGVQVAPASGTTFVSMTRDDMENNVGGGLVMGGGAGETQVNLTDSIVAHNVTNGVDVEGTGSSPLQFLTIRNDNLVMNGGDGLLANGAKAFILFGTSTIAWNHNGVVSTNGGLVFSYRSSEINGNAVNDISGTVNTVANQ